DCAVLTLVQTRHPFVVFKTQHFVSSDAKMVVTEADPARRIVTEINGEPAGREYARLVGLDVDKLTPLIFSTYPVVVKLGGAYYVRSIQKVNEDESLTFFCAIDAGIVLTVARGVDMIENLSATFAEIREQIGPPALVLGCDCILRDLELDQRDIRGPISDILVENNVVGFATYGEQYNAMHVNQTFTGVAIGTRS
ncbi:MAG: FIST C-terminal domain-containing protein, partial [Myxococcales bacterium]|nr:FIST C-terminal domain-containing protein [Myxococcales bacterium]